MKAKIKAAIESANWPYKSHADLYLAGFRMRGKCNCPICGVKILIYRQFQSFPVFLDSTTFKKHLNRIQHAQPTERQDG